LLHLLIVALVTGTFLIMLHGGVKHHRKDKKDTDESPEDINVSNDSITKLGKRLLLELCLTYIVLLLFLFLLCNLLAVHHHGGFLFQQRFLWILIKSGTVVSVSVLGNIGDSASSEHAKKRKGNTDWGVLNWVKLLEKLVGIFKLKDQKSYKLRTYSSEIQEI
jgi:hypothetical protein